MNSYFFRTPNPKEPIIEVVAGSLPEAEKRLRKSGVIGFVCTNKVHGTKWQSGYELGETSKANRPGGASGIKDITKYWKP